MIYIQGKKPDLQYLRYMYKDVSLYMKDSRSGMEETLGQIYNNDSSGYMYIRNESSLTCCMTERLIVCCSVQGVVCCCCRRSGAWMQFSLDKIGCAELALIIICSEGYAYNVHLNLIVNQRL